ncbi:hypothetical protein IPH70_02165 [Candidatus Roizmanbacteria bacterium]|nr:MAG: hypothetical protein IPH70_02165 [Candidatus Roizmanbacteria bacterium]
MRKRSIFWIGLFTILVVANLIIALRYVQKVKRVSAANTILNEIDASYEFDQSFANEGVTAEVKLGDARVANLKRFFRKYNSPLYDDAEFIVTTADKYEFDYRLLPAIAMQESGLCRVIPNNSYNCWGWGIYGTTVTRFDSYQDAIMAVSKGIKTYYIDKGLTTTEQIMAKYTPSSNGSWANGVNTFIRALE